MEKRMQAKNEMDGNAFSFPISITRALINILFKFGGHIHSVFDLGFSPYKLHFLLPDS